jgi:hypothetical protein
MVYGNEEKAGMLLSYGECGETFGQLVISQKE